MRNGKWQVAATAIEGWGKTFRFCLILVVSALCTVAPLVAVALIR